MPRRRLSLEEQDALDHLAEKMTAAGPEMTEAVLSLMVEHAGPDGLTKTMAVVRETNPALAPAVEAFLIARGVWKANL